MGQALAEGWHERSAQSSRPGGQTVVVGHSETLEAQEPSGHCTVLTGQVRVAGHLLLSVTQVILSGHMTGAAGGQARAVGQL